MLCSSCIRLMEVYSQLCADTSSITQTGGAFKGPYLFLPMYAFTTHITYTLP